MELPEEAVPLAEIPEEVELPEDPVPLANVPKTGDLSALWYAVLTLSAAGLLCLTALERKKETEI